MKTALQVNAKAAVPALLAFAMLVVLPPAASAQSRFGGPGLGRRGGSVTWSGTVDDTTVVTIHGSDVGTQVVSGKSSSDVNAQVTGRLPSRPVRLFLRQRQGRGEIRIVQQPNPGNNFTGRVRIHDPQGGSSFYRFALGWRHPRGFGGGPGAF